MTERMTIVRIIVVRMPIMRVVIMVVAMVVMRMIVPGVPVMGMPGMAVRVVMAFAQQPSARQVDAQAEPRDRHRLAEVDDDRMQTAAAPIRSRSRARSDAG